MQYKNYKPIFAKVKTKLMKLKKIQNSEKMNAKNLNNNSLKEKLITDEWNLEEIEPLHKDGVKNLNKSWKFLKEPEKTPSLKTLKETKLIRIVAIQVNYYL